jgi:hypothetical protein
MADQKITDLTELTAPVAADLLPIVDDSEATAANKNKKIQYGTFLRNLPSGTVGAPGLAWTADTGLTGIYRSGTNETAFANNSTLIGKFTTTGFQLGTGTAAAQLHLFSSDTTDQVIIENTDSGLDTAPDLVLYRNSSSPAANDNLGNIEFRGKDSAGNDQVYGQLTATASSPTSAAEVGIVDLMSADAGTSAMRVRLKGQYVGVHEPDPAYPLHVSTVVTSTALNVEAVVDDAASAADITMLHKRGDTTVAQDDDLISTVFYRAHNDASPPTQVDYCAIEGSIVDASDATEDGRLRIKLIDNGALTTKVTLEPAAITVADAVDLVFDTTTGTKIGTATTQKIGFYNATPVVQPAAVANLTTTATSGALPTADGSVTIADATTPTVTELLEYCVELEAKLEAALAHLRTLGLIAT